MRWWWAGGLVLLGCWKDNPGFLGELLETSSSGAPASSSGSGSSTDTSSTGTSAAASETTGPVQPGTSTSTTATTSMTSTTAGTDTTDGSSTSGPLSEHERCEMAAAADPVGSYPLTCGEPYAAWSFGPSVDMPTMSTMCGVESTAVGVIATMGQAMTESGALFNAPLLLGPRASKPGLIQGEFTGLDLSTFDLPCLATRIDYAPGMAWAQLEVQVVVYDHELGQTLELFVPPVPLPHDMPVELALPFMAEGTIDVALVVHRKGMEGGEIPALLWESPRILDAGP